jgi:hypothetical protein
MRSILLLSVLLAHTGLSQAATVVFDGSSVASDILGIEIIGITYNVSFEVGSFDSLSVGDNFPFLNDRAGIGASSAAAAINAALNEVSAYLVGPDSASGISFYTIPHYEFSVDGVGRNYGRISYRLNPDGWTDYTSRNHINSDTTARYAVFSTVVPIPAAVWLFGSALAGLGWIKRTQAT